MFASSRPTSGMRRAIAGVAAAIFAAVVLAPAPAMANMDPEPPVITGAPYVGSTLTVSWDPMAYKAAPRLRARYTHLLDSRRRVGRRPYNLAPPLPPRRRRPRQNHRSAPGGKPSCEGLEVASEETAPISASNRPPNGFTSRGAFELLARRSDGAW